MVVHAIILTVGRLRQETSFEFNVSLGYITWTSQVRVTQWDPGLTYPTACNNKKEVSGWHVATFLRSTCFPCAHCTFPFLPASTSWMPSQRCSACSHAGSQRPCNSAQGKLLYGWLRWWLHHLVRNRGHSCAGEDIIYLQHFSQCNCFSHINLKLQFRHMFLGCLSGVQTLRHFSNLIRNHVRVAVPP